MKLSLRSEFLAKTELMVKTNFETFKVILVKTKMALDPLTGFSLHLRL